MGEHTFPPHHLASDPLSHKLITELDVSNKAIIHLRRASASSQNAQIDRLSDGMKLLEDSMENLKTDKLKMLKSKMI